MRLHLLLIPGAIAVAATVLVACSPQAPAGPEPAPQAATPAPAPSKYAEVESPGAAHDHLTAYRSETVDVRLAAAGDKAKGHEVEYMVRMNGGDALTYAWEARDAGDFWHEFHGHTTDTVTFYKKAGGTRHQGSLTAPFDGIHGWYFENRTARPVTVRIRLSGFYELEPAKK